MGGADVDRTQTIGGDTVKLLGRYIPPGFGTLLRNAQMTFQSLAAIIQNLLYITLSSKQKTV